LSDEAQLSGCARFLQCREEWLAELVAELDERSVYDYLKRLTDVHRLQLFDVVMQYRAIFADDGPPADGAPGAGGGAGGADGGALYSWAEHRVCAPRPPCPSGARALGAAASWGGCCCLFRRPHLSRAAPRGRALALGE
jgi:hypothetical protein